MAEAELRDARVYPKTVIAKLFPSGGHALSLSREDIERMGRAAAEEFKPLDVKPILRGWAVLDAETKQILVQGISWQQVDKWLSGGGGAGEGAYYWNLDRYQGENTIEVIRYDRVDRSYRRWSNLDGSYGVTLTLAIPGRELIYTAVVTWFHAPGHYAKLTIDATSWEVFLDQEDWLRATLVMNDTGLTQERFERGLAFNHYEREEPDA